MKKNTALTLLAFSTILSSTLAGTAAAGEAAAAPAAPTAPTAPAPSVNPPKFSALPVGQVTTAPQKKPPAAIGARESVPGFYVVSQDWGPQVPVQHRSVSIVGDPKVAESMKPANMRKSFRRVEDTSGMCFAESRFARFGIDPTGATQDSRAFEWDRGSVFTNQARATPQQKNDPGSGVTAIHSEKVIDQGGGRVSLESVDAWVDPVSRGARLIAKASLPLALVGTAPGGVKVYAARDERPDGARSVQFVVHNPHDPSNANVGLALNQMWATRQSGEVVHGGCDHLRVSIPIDRDEHAVFQAQVVLPNADGSAPPKPAPKPNDGNNPFAFNGEDRPEREVRARSMEVQVSLSRTSRDKEPVVSISFGWASREQVSRVPI